MRAPTSHFVGASIARPPCAGCTEKLCRHKRRLRSFIRKHNFDRFGQRFSKKS